MNYYSQHGEDYILDIIFSDIGYGYFVEVGCIDGLRFSNTLTFAERGWKGMCVEAHSDYIEVLKENRPESVVCHCAAAEENADNVSFYANDRGSLSTLDKTREEEFRENYGEYFSGFEKQSVSKRRLDSLFEEHNAPNKIDILSIDVEGNEVEALKGMSFKKFRPRVLVIESDSKSHETSLDKLLIPEGYIKEFRIRQNIFYFENKNLPKKVEKNMYVADITHTPHPLDGGESKTKEIEINLYRYNVRSKIKRKIKKIYSCLESKL